MRRTVASRLHTGHGVGVVEVLERGDIRFFFRPTVQPAEDEWGEKPAPGVQSFFVVLSPAGGRAHRRVRIGRKRMPIPPAKSPVVHDDRDPDDNLDDDDGERRAEAGHRLGRSSERFWCRVERVGSFERVIGGMLEDEHYTTKTRGDRFQPAARVIAQGCYAFVRHDDHTHLVYRLEHAEHDDVPDEVRVPDAASNVVLFENTAPTTSRSRKAVWTTAGDPDLLDHEGEELVLVGVDDNPARHRRARRLTDQVSRAPKPCPGPGPKASLPDRVREPDKRSRRIRRGHGSSCKPVASRPCRLPRSKH